MPSQKHYKLVLQTTATPYDEEVDAASDELQDLEKLRPKTRSDCAPCAECVKARLVDSYAPTCGHPESVRFRHARPCVFISCRYHLFLDIRPTGTVTINSDDRRIDTMPATCALDVADHFDGVTLESTGTFLNVTRERIRQIEHIALDRLRDKGEP